MSIRKPIYRRPLADHYQHQRTLAELRRQLAALKRYTEELQKQLEPSVLEEIRTNLEAR